MPSYSHTTATYAHNTFFNVSPPPHPVIKVKPGNLYKCNMGGVYKVEGPTSPNHMGKPRFTLRIIGCWHESGEVVHRRDAIDHGARTVLHHGFAYGFNEDGQTSNDGIYLIGVIEP